MEKKQNPKGPMFLGTEPVKNLIWKFALPGIASSLITAVYNIVDQIFIGWGVGDLGIAATNIAFPLSTMITALSALLGLGGATKFNLAMGKGKTDEAKKTIGGSLALMILVGLVLCIAGICFLQPMLYAFGATNSIMPYAQPYTLLICVGLPFGIFSTGASHLIRADGHPNLSMLVLLSGSIFNLIFDPIFLFGFNMGIQGIALATALGQILSSIIAFYYLYRKFSTVTLDRTCFQIRGDITKSICSLGAAVCFTHIAATAVQIVLSNVLRYYGMQSIYGSEVALAAAGAVSKVMILLMSCVIGISLGSQPIVGYNYGSKQYARVKQAYFLTLKYASLIAVFAFICIQLFPRQILSIFGSSDPLFYEFATKYMRIYLFMTFANAVQPVTSTFFTSIGKAKLGFWMALTRQVLLLIPLLLILPVFWGISGVLWAGPLADGITVILVIALARRELRAISDLQMNE